MPDTPTPLHISNTFIALDDACHARPLPVTEDFWPALISGRLGQFSRLISSFSFDADWPSWEKHPAGEEFVCLLEGEVELVLDRNGEHTRVVLNTPGSYVLVPTDTWHTVKVRRPSRMLFVTPGEGTLNRLA
jgi:quercetin dioxygenase-like cupin family protein